MSRPDNIAPDEEWLEQLPGEGAYVDPAGNVLTNDEFDAIMRDIGVYPELLTNDEIDSVLREYGWLYDPYADEPGWRSGVVDLEDPKGKTWPTREEMYEVDVEGFDPLRPMEGFLAVSYSQGDDRWTEWQRVGKSRETWDWMWPDVVRFYRLLKRMREKAHEYTYRYARFRWLPYPEGIDRATVMHGAVNCAIAILRERFLSQARALTRIDTAGGFGKDQLWEASGVLKRNMRLLNRLDGVIFETKKEDGQWRFNGVTRHGKPIPPVDLYDYDGHALGFKPVRPSGLVDDDVVKEDKVGSYHDLKRHYGPNALIWPSSEGYIVDLGPGDTFVVRDAERYSAIERRAQELQVSGTALMVSPFSVEVKAWRSLNGFDSTPAALAKVWRAANMYPRPYSNLKAPQGPSADVNSAYESSPKAGANDLFLKYGFPKAEGQIVVKDPPMEVLGETGLVVAHLDLERCHPWVQYQVKERRGVYTTMRLQTWLDAGAVAIDRLELAVIAQRYWPSLERPADARYSPSKGERWVPGQAPRYEQTKHWGREAIGRLVPNGEKHQDYLFVTDDSEAASVIQTLRKAGTLTSFSFERAPVPREKDERTASEQIEDVLQELTELTSSGEPEAEPEIEYERAGLWRVGFKTEGLPKDACFHAHAYWLDYSAMVIDREVFRHPWDAVVRVATDSITLAQGHEFSDQVEYEKEVPGKWKVETPKMREYGDPAPREVPDLAEVEKIAGPYWAPICGSEPRMHVLEGPPGYGKTYHCIERLTGHCFTVLTPTRKMRKKFLADDRERREKLTEEERRRIPALKALTWRWALRPYEKFKADMVRVARGSLLYLTEIGTWPRKDVAELVPWLLENGYRLLADGDREQMRPVKAEAPWAWLDAEPSVTIQFFAEKDHRSKTEELAAFKMSLRGKTNAVIIDKLRRELGETDYNEFLDLWHPRDYVYACVHDVWDKVLHAILPGLHEDRYPDEPVRIRYTEKSRERSGEEEYIPLGSPLPEHSELAYVTTYTSCQGETAGKDENGRHPRVWLVDSRASEFFKGALYTGATRVEYMEQLGLVCNVPIPPTAKEKALHEEWFGVDEDLPVGYNED